MRRWVLWIGSLAIVTTVLFSQRELLDRAHVALLYLLVGLGASSHAGRRCGLTIALLSFLLFNFLFVPPYYTFAVTHPADWLVLAAFLITSATAAQLLSRARDQTEAANSRAAEIDRLSSLGSETLNVARPEDALSAIAEVIRATLAIDRAEIFVGNPSGTIDRVATVGVADGSVDSAYLAGEQLVEWVARSGQTVIERADAAARVLDDDTGDGAQLSENVRDARTLLLPLRVQGRIVGVLRITGRDRIRLQPAQERFLKALAYYAALGVERVRLVAEARHAEALREADRIKDSLLASVSHDLRTPLTTIKGLAQELRMEGDERAALIEEEADRLNRFVVDLLDLSRLSAGAVRVRCEIHPIDDLLGAALQRVSGRLDGRVINASLSSDDPLLVGRYDFGHSLRALVNLIENAVKHSPPDGPIDVTVERTGDVVGISVADRGPGIAAADESRIFQPFYRCADGGEDADGGAGLGLSIAQGLATAQGGRIECAARAGGGTVFTLQLPAADLEGPLVGELMKS